ncbi:hypothetical protein OCH239_12815 [Roseivivax halodurans JCM 10272]|uniref:Transposase n=1 Tax=Roseivivax halodurans JCM 10272 TaxID=1449350 RepID=X7EDJ1_9RHOB|nr:hypothetical protein OCH239_12815 [Roseivivax halodurans JCM 10272]
MLMSNDDIRRVEVIIGVARRRYWPAHEKLRIIEESLVPGESISAVAGRNGVAPNLLFRWRRLMDEDEPLSAIGSRTIASAMAVGSNEPVVGAFEVRKLEDRVRDFERLLGRKTMENEILRGPKGPWPRWGRVSPKDMAKAQVKASLVRSTHASTVRGQWRATWHLPSPPKSGSR